MTNLEYYADGLKKYIYDYSERCGGHLKSDEVANGVRIFINMHPEIWEGDINAEEAIDWFLSEHVTPIRLKQWEKDLLEISDYQETRFDFYTGLSKMKKRGYFEGITNTNMGIKEILENCEVVDD